MVTSMALSTMHSIYASNSWSSGILLCRCSVPEHSGLPGNLHVQSQFAKIIPLFLSFAGPIPRGCPTLDFPPMRVPHPCAFSWRKGGRPRAGYAPNGNILTHADSVMGTWNFSYDAVDRLSTATPGA